MLDKAMLLDSSTSCLVAAGSSFGSPLIGPSGYSPNYAGSKALGEDFIVNLSSSVSITVQTGSYVNNRCIQYGSDDNDPGGPSSQHSCTYYVVASPSWSSVATILKNEGLNLQIYWYCEAFSFSSATTPEEYRDGKTGVDILEANHTLRKYEATKTYTASTLSALSSTAQLSNSVSGEYTHKNAYEVYPTFGRIFIEFVAAS